MFEILHAELSAVIPCHRLAIRFLKPGTETLVTGPVRSDGEVLLGTRHREEIPGTPLERCFSELVPVAFNDLTEVAESFPRFNSARLLALEGMRSDLSVPLVADGRPIGLICFSHRERGAYAEDHTRFLSTIAGQIAVVIERGRLISRLRADNRKLEKANELTARFVERLQEEVSIRTAALQRAEAEQRLLLTIARAIHGTLDLHHVFRTLVDSLRSLVAFDRSSIVLLETERRVLEYRELEPEDRSHLGRGSRLPLAGSAAGKAIADGLPVVVADTEGRASYYEDPFLRLDGIRSYVCLPLFIKGRPIGALDLGSKEPGRYAGKELEFLTQLADQLSVAAANAESHRKVEALKDHLQEENLHLREAMSLSPMAGHMVGDSVAWRRLVEAIEMVAPTDATVLIRGETGTGKELVARAIHELSGRRERPFVAINCGAIAGELISSELFGHEKGAFTGAGQRRLGRIELAQGGTLFLDEISELDVELQVKLLRVLQEREYERVGGSQTLRANVRILAATNRDLDAERRAGRFRDDLFYRLNVFPIAVPALRERMEDIEPLLVHFLSKFSRKAGKDLRSVAPESLRRCLAYSWPGNVRELENLVERSVILCRGDVLEVDPGPLDVPPPVGTNPRTLDDAIRSELLAVLTKTRGRIYGKGGAAELLGLKPSTLQAKLKKHGINRKQVLND